MVKTRWKRVNRRVDPAEYLLQYQTAPGSRWLDSDFIVTNASWDSVVAATGGTRVPPWKIGQKMGLRTSVLGRVDTVAQAKLDAIARFNEWHRSRGYA